MLDDFGAGRVEDWPVSMKMEWLLKQGKSVAISFEFKAKG